LIDTTVLIVDDSEAIVESLVETLERLGVPRDQILTAHNPEDALKLFNAQKPPLVFMDLDLDGAPGEKAAMKILKQEPRTKVVLMTGYDRKDPRVRDMISAGAYEFMEKPLRFGKIQQVLELIDSENKGLRRVS
jgi:DNA-binding NtrC family response regulator